MEVKKTGTGLKVLIGILTFLLCATIGYIVADKFIFSNKVDNNAKNDVVNKEEGTIKEENKNTNNESNTDISKQSTSKNNSKKYINVDNYNTSYHLYSIFGASVMIGYEGKMYVVENHGLTNSYEIDECVNKIKSATFKNNSYHCVTEASLYSEEESYIYIHNLNVNESDIYNAKIFNNVFTSDAQYCIYLIYTDGRVVKHYMGGEGQGQSKNVFKNYKVEDMSLRCTTPADVGCKEATYTLTLMDGTVKSVTTEE